MDKFELYEKLEAETKQLLEVVDVNYPKVSMAELDRLIEIKYLCEKIINL